MTIDPPWVLTAAAVGASAAAAIDIAWRRIPNAFTYSLAAAGLVSQVAFGSIVAGILGLAIGLSLGLLLFLLGSAGGGDAKLISAMGAMLGPGHIIDVCLLTIVVAVPVVLATLVCTGQGGQLARDMRLMVIAIATLQPISFPVRSYGSFPLVPMIAVAAWLILAFPALALFSSTWAAR
jgi:Flp pilus assembly protein protease CpaA